MDNFLMNARYEYNYKIIPVGMFYSQINQKGK